MQRPCTRTYSYLTASPACGLRLVFTAPCRLCHPPQVLGASTSNCAPLPPALRGAVAVSDSIPSIAPAAGGGRPVRLRSSSNADALPAAACAAASPRQISPSRTLLPRPALPLPPAPLQALPPALRAAPLPVLPQLPRLGPSLSAPPLPSVGGLHTHAHSSSKATNSSGSSHHQPRVQECVSFDNDGNEVAEEVDIGIPRSRFLTSLARDPAVQQQPRQLGVEGGRMSGPEAGRRAEGGPRQLGVEVSVRRDRRDDAL